MCFIAKPKLRGIEQAKYMVKPVRVDYRKYRQGVEDFYITNPDSTFVGWK